MLYKEIFCSHFVLVEKKEKKRCVPLKGGSGVSFRRGTLLLIFYIFLTKLCSLLLIFNEVLKKEKYEE